MTGTTKFSLRGTPLLAAGSTMDLVGKAPCLWAHLKVYSEGGENGVHAHPYEDHLFLVLAGEATFIDDAGTETVVGVHEGMVVPRSTYYAFHSSGEGNLVLLRVGSPADSSLIEEGEQEEHLGIPASVVARIGVQPLSADNKTGAVPGVPIPGQFFGS